MMRVWQLRVCYIRQCLLSMCCLICLHSSAQTREVVRVGIEQIDYYPHYDFSKTPPRGYFYELMMLFAKDAGVQLEFVPLPVRRLYQTATDQIDLVYPDNPRWQKYLVVDLKKVYSVPLEMNLGTTFVLAAKRDISLSQFRTLANIHGFTPTRWLELQPTYRYKLVEVADAQAALGLVLKGRVDGANVEYHVAMQFIQQQQLEGQLVVGRQLPYTELPFLLSSARKPALIARFNLFMQTHAAEVQQLRQKYRLFQQLPQAPSLK